MMQQPGQQSMAPPPQQQQQAPQQYQQVPPTLPPYMMMSQQSQPPQPHMWAPHYPQASLPYQQPPPQQQLQAPHPGQPASADEVRTLWVGDLQYWMDENYLLSCFSHSGEVVSVKVIRHKQTAQVEYGFIEFISRSAAERALQAYNGTPMPNSEQSFRLNWATFGGGEKRDDGADFTVFVGDLAPDVTDYMLQETFRAHYTSVKGAKVVIDRLTGRPKGYGFVRFGDESEQLRAINEMNGAFCSTRQMRVGHASNRKTGAPQQYPKDSYQASQTQTESDPNNTTIFVGNLDSNVTDIHLKELFGQCGQLLHVKIPAGKRCGFVQFSERSSAEEALRVLNGTQLGGQNIRLSWGHSPNKQAQPQAEQWNNGGQYGYGQGYENYQQPLGYAHPAAAATQDPNLYYGAYSGYGNNQQQQQHHQQ